MQRVTVGFSGGGDAQSGARRVPDDAIELVGAGIGNGRVDLVFKKPHFLLYEAVGPTDIEAAGRHGEVLWQRDAYALRVYVDGGARFNHVGDALEADPATGVARHRPAVQSVVEVLLHVGRVEYRDARGLERMLALVRHG